MASFDKVRPGSKLRIPAGDYNATMDVARWFATRSKKTGAGEDSPYLPAGCVYCQNDSETDIEEFKPVSVISLAIEPSYNEAEFKYHPVFKVAASGADDVRFGITQEPIAGGCVGVVMMCGVSPCRVLKPSKASDGDMNVGPSGEDGVLELSRIGGQLIWWENKGVNEECWGMVRFPAYYLLKSTHEPVTDVTCNEVTKKIDITKEDAATAMFPKDKDED